LRRRSTRRIDCPPDRGSTFPGDRNAPKPPTSESPTPPIDGRNGGSEPDRRRRRGPADALAQPAPPLRLARGANQGHLLRARAQCLRARDQGLCRLRPEPDLHRLLRLPHAAARHERVHEGPRDAPGARRRARGVVRQAPRAAKGARAQGRQEGAAGGLHPRVVGPAREGRRDEEEGGGEDAHGRAGRRVRRQGPEEVGGAAGGGGGGGEEVRATVEDALEDFPMCSPHTARNRRAKRRTPGVVRCICWAFWIYGLGHPALWRGHSACTNTILSHTM
ncbi:hypothetical protein CT0861_03877, partial [Colletotrichum tofieldiae]